MPKVTIRIDLEGELAEKFNALKAKHGLKSNAELVRLLITAAYEKIK